jgi:large repetitive protein
LSYQQAFTVNITDVNEAPTNIAIDNFNIDENSPANSVVGNLTTTDPDLIDTATYTLAAGTGDIDNSKFAVVGNKLQINQSPDFEAKSSYTIRLQTTDKGGLSYEKQLTISVNNLNEAPTSLTLSNNSVAENIGVNGVIGIFTSTDPDLGDTKTYTLIAGLGDVDNSQFTIVGDKLQLKSNPDFESKSSYQLRARVTDASGLSYEKAFTVNITDVNEAPTNVAIDKSNIDENSPANSVVGNLTTTDPDLIDTATYTLAAGTGDIDNSKFTIVGDKLQIKNSPDFETQSSYSIRIRTTDKGGLTLDKVLTIGVNNLNEAPTSLTLSNNSVAENIGVNGVIGTFTSTDPDLGDTKTYTLIAGLGDIDNSQFTIVGDKLQLKSNPDFESKSSYQLRARVTDTAGLSYEQAFTVNITNVNEAPTALNITNTTVAENVPGGTVVGNLSTIDPDLADTHTYTLVNGTGAEDNGAFEIVNNQLKFLVSPNFETKSNYSLRVRTTDAGGLSIEKILTVNITNVNEAPTQLVLDITSVAENSPIGTLVGKFISIDPDLGDSHTYSLIAGNGSGDNAKFTIISNELRLSISPDFETQSVYHLRVQTKDAGGLTWEQELTVNILDLLENQAPTAIGLTNSSIAENSANNTLVARLNTTDPDPTDTHTYTLLNDAGGRFKLVGDELRVANGNLLDFEIATSHQIRVRTTDNGNPSFAYERDITIGITNVNETPLFTSNPVLSANSGQPYSYTITTTDPDTGDTRQISTSLPLPSWLSLIDNGNGTATLSGNPGVSDTGFFKINLVVTDAGGLKNNQEFNLGVATTLIEGTSFNKHLDIPLTIPATGGKISFKLDPLQFDGTDLKGINDALEVALVDAQGKSLVTPFQTGQDAFFNWTEGENVVTGKGVSYDAATGIVTLDLTGVKPGAANLVFRLINNDKDTTTSVRLTDLTLSPIAPLSPLSPAPVPLSSNSPSPVAPTFFNTSTDVSSSILADYHRTSLNGAIKELDVNVALKNQGSYSLNGTLVVVVNHISDPSVQVRNADGFTPEGLPYYTFATINGKLDPNSVTGEKTLVFRNPNGVQFSYDLTVLANLNAAPIIKSLPGLEVIGGKQYQYQVKAEDINGDSLTYKLLTAPSGMSIDPTTGLVSWNTSVSQIGTERISVEVSDGRGGIAQQDYNLVVTDIPPNRPPVITSTPVVDAFVDKPFKDTATAVDPDGDVPISYSLITAPPGMSIDPLTGKIEWKPSPTVILGDTVLSRIRTPGEINEFSFSGIKGQKIYFDPLQYAGAVGQWRFDLYSPTGKKVIDGANFEWNQSRLLTLVEDGNYHISVRTNGDATGNYGFRLIDAALTPQLKFDEKVQAQFTPGTQDRLFRFTGNQGQKLYFDQITKSGDLDWTIYNAANQVISNNTAEDTEIDLPANGDYILAVRGRSGFASTAAIDFTIIAPELTTQVMPLNTPISGAIAKRGEQDSYTFTGTAGQQLFYDALGGDYFTLKLLDPTGRQIFITDSRGDAGPDVQGLTLGINGTYQVVVDGNGGDIGNYRFRFLDKAAATLVALDTDIVGKLDATNGTASYRFKVDADNTYLYFDAQAGNYPNHWLLYGNDGKLVKDYYIYDDNESALKAGEYWLVMWGRDSADVNYKMRIVTPDFTTTSLTLGAIVSSNISEAGERDTYTFTGVAGQQVWYDALGGDPLNVKLYDPLGREFSSYTNDNRLDQGVDYFVLKMDGTYKLVFDPGNNATGNYKFRLFDKSQATSINFNTEIVGTLNQITPDVLDTNLYRFTATAGQKLYLDTGNGQAGNLWGVYGVDGKLLNYGHVQSGYYDDWEFDAPKTGEYVLAIMGRGAANPNYKFTLYAPALTVTPITLDSIVSGTISQPGEQDSYTFTGTAEQQLFYDPLNSNNFAAIRIYDPNGTEIRTYNGRETQDLGLDYLTLNLNGTYKVVIDGDGANLGDYKFRLLDKATATVITSNLEVTGTFDNNGLGSKLYRFNAQAGEHFYLNTGGGQYPNTWLIYDPNGQFVKSGYTQDGYYDDFEFDVTKAGEYTLALEGNGAANTNYKFTLTNSPLSVTPLTLGSVVSGAISQPGEKDTYTFTGTNGQQVWYDALGGDPLNVKLYDPLGREFASYTNDNRLDQGVDFFALKMDGTYKLVFDPAGTATGNYKFRLLDKAQATAISFNTEVTGSLNQITPGDLDTNLYRFTATAGQKLYLDTSGGQANNTWGLYGVDGKFISNGYVATGNRDDWEFDVPKTGEYVLAMLGYGAANPNYKFTLYAPELTVTPITVDSIVSGTISQPGEQDSYTFTGISGQQLFYDPLNSNNFAAIRIYDPNGTELRTINGRETQDVGMDYLALNLNGTYKVVIDGDGANIGDYKFRLLDKANATVITPEIEVVNTFDNNGLGSKLYRFNAQAGEHFYLNTGAGQYPNAWIIYDSNGQQVKYGHTQDGYYDDWEFDIIKTGEYTLALEGNGAANTNYKFTLTNSPLTVTPLVLGSTITGTIAKQGEQDTYTFSGVAGQRLHFDILNRGGYYTNVARIYTPSGLEIFGRNFYDQDFQDLIALKETGNYKVVIDGYGANTDAYSFKLADVSAATNIGYDVDVSGQLATGQETAWYQFTGVKGQKLYLDWLSNSPNTAWSLYDSGSQPIDNRGVSDYEFVLTHDDTYTIGIRGYHNAAVDYKFRVIPSTVSRTAITIEGNNTPIVTGTIAKKGETDEFTFSGVAGQKIYYDQIALINATIKIYSPAGVEQGKNGFYYSDVDGFYQLSETGTYRVVVDGNGEAIGDYSFRLLNGNLATVLPLNTPITGSESLNSSITNLYKFSGVAGQRVYIDAGGGGTGNSNIWVLYNPNGEYVARGILRDNYYDDYEFDLASSGQYTIALIGVGSGTSSYRLSVNTKADVAALSLGSPVSNNISQAGERDTYSFNGTVGQQLWFDAIAGNGNLKAQLYSPTGKLVQDRDTNVDWGAFNLEETGTYRLVIDGAGAATGNYQFNLSDRATATSLKLGEATTGSLTNKTNLYKFVGKAGQVVKFDLAATTWAGANWTFSDPSGKVIATPAAGSPDFQVALASDGNYTLALAGTSVTAVNYSFIATDVTPAKITPTGLNVIQSGTYLPGQAAEYSFKANAGTVILYDSIQTTGYMLARLVAPDGSYVTLDPFNYGGGAITWDNNYHLLNPVTLQQTGTYKLQTYSYYPWETGAYKYALRELPKNFGPGVTYLELDTPISGSLTSGESKVYTFQTNPGEKVLFNGIQGAGINARLYDASGTEVIRFDNFNSNDTNLATLATGGIYNLVIDAPTNSGVNNNYQFQLLNTTSARAIPDNLAQAGTIANGQTSQIFKLNANAGERLFFDSLNASSTNRWKLYDAGNKLLFDNEQRYDAEIVAPTTGDYYLYFQGGTSTAPVNYNFRVIANTQPIADILTPGTGAVGSNPDTNGIATFAVKLGATDTKGASATQDYRVRLWADPTNANPVIISEPVKRFALDDKAYRYQVKSTDANGDNLVYRLLDAPTGALIDRASGELFWFPETIIKPGDKANFQVEVSDGRGGKDLQTFTVDVFGKLGTIQGSVFDDLNSNGFRDTKLIKGDNPAVVLAIDVSGSTIAPFYGEKGGKAISTVLQAEIAAAEALIDTVISQGGGSKVKFAIIPHQVSAYIQDMDLTTPGIQVYTTATADTNNNGIADIREILHTYTPDGSNNFTTALQTIDTLFTALPGDPNLIFMSDGYGRLDPIVATQVVNDIKAKGGNVTALAIGEASSLDTLQKISADAQKVTDFQKLINIFSGVDESFAIEPLKENVTVYLDLNNNGVFDPLEPFQITHPNPQPDALGESSYYYRFDNLLPGSYTVRTLVPTGWEITTTPISFTDTITVAGEDIAHLSGFGKIGVPENIAPVFITTAPGVTKLKAGEVFKYAAVAVDGNADPLSFDLINAPSGMSVDKQTGIVAWKPTAAQIDVYYAEIIAEQQRLTALGRGAFARTIAEFDLLLRVSDGKGGQSLQSLKLQLAPNNTAPVFTSTPPITNPQTGKVFKYQATAIDAQASDILTYSLTTPITGVAINATTGLLTWTPTTGQTGKTNISIKVSDGNGGEAIQTLNLDVITPVANRAPVINSSPRITTSTLSEYRYQINASDLDGDSLTYQLVSPPSGMTVNNSGLIIWNPTAAQIGTYQINLKVSDGSLATNQTYKLDVTNQPINHTPTITSNPNLVTNLERPYSYNATATDSDGDTLTWSLDKAPAGMVIDTNTGALRWNPSQSQIGTHTIGLRATDSLGAYVGQEYTLKVNGINTPPQIQSTPNTIGGINSPYKYQIKAIDLEGDTLTYTLGRYPNGMVVNANTGLITWTPTTTQTGTQTIDVLVTDAQGAVATQTYNLVVGTTPINQAPSITSTPKFTADINTKYQYQIVATDPENQQLTYALTTAPAGMVIDTTTGLITWDNPTLGTTNIQITATDTSGAVAAQGYTLTGKQNQAPVINSTPKTQVTIGNTYRYDVKATDSDNDALIYTVDDASKLAGITIDKLGRITWKPTTVNIGIKPVTVTVTDAIGAVVTQTYNLEVLADNTAPVVNLVRGTNIADIGETISFQIQATDNVGIKSTQLLINNQAVALDSNGVGTYKVTTAGIVTAQAIVTDVNGNTNTASTTTNIIDPTDVEAPTVKLDLTSITNGIITGRTDIKGTATDTNLDYYTVEVARLGTNNFKEVFRGTNSITNGTLGKFDPSLLENDTYTIRLTAYDTNGHISSIEDELEVTGDLKLGNFRLSFTDLTIPVTGIPISLTRTYDSLTSGTTDDFGYGWRMEFRDTDLRTSLKADPSYEQLDYRTVGFKAGTRVYITLPGGKREGFTFQPKQVQGALGGLTGGRLFYPNFVADKGVTSSLTVPGAEYKDNTATNDFALGSSGNPNGILIERDGKLFNLNGRPYVPQDDGFGNRYLLTTKDGTQYEINATTGDLETVTDTNGNTLTYSDTAIVSSTGVQVTFERDNQGRITSVTDPMGQKVLYGYDPKGDLVSVKDRDGNETKFHYDATRSHYLDKIIDPLGREAVKTEYDEAGRLKKTANSSGNGVEFVYNPNNSLETVKDALGNATTFEYDSRGNVVTEVDALGGITYRTYDDDNNLLSETDAENRTTTHTYDTRGNELSQTDALGHSRFYSYDPNGRLLTSIDELGDKTEYIRDTHGNILTKIDANKDKTTYTYDGHGNKLTEKNALGKTTTYVYDPSGRKIIETDALGHEIQYKYNDNGLETETSQKVTLADGVHTIITSKTHDAQGNLTSETDADGNTVNYQYNKNGKRILTIAPLNRQTSESYDDNNRLTKMVFADGLSTEFTYDLNGNRLTSKDRAGLITRYTYDALNHATALIAPDSTPDNPDDNLRKLMTYDKTGWLTSITDERQQTTSFKYDAVGNQIWSQSYIDTTPIITTATYDDARHRTSTTDALGHKTSYGYDKVGRLTATTYDDGLSDLTTYNALGKEILKVDRAGRTTSYDYDALQRLTAVTLPAVDGQTATTTHSYDERGLMVGQIDALQRETKYEYDLRGLRTGVVRPEGQRSTTSYNIFGNVSGSKDFNGVTTSYTYDDINRLTTEQRNGQNIAAYTYTANGQKATITDARGTTSYTYRPEGQLTQVLNSDGTFVRYIYDGAELRSVTTPYDTTSYTYDTQGRLKTTAAHGETTSYRYDVLGNQIGSTLANGVVETKSYDNLNRLTNVNQAKGGNVLANYAYTLDAVGNKIKVVENGRQVDFSYDNRDRLTKEVVTAGANIHTTSYTYDAVSNRLTKNDSTAGLTTYSYSANDWLLSEVNGTQTTAYTYDANGNNQTKNEAGNLTTYSWNADNRLVGVNANNHIISYEYDRAGMRTAQTVDGVRTNYLLDVSRENPVVLAEYGQTNATTVTYTYGGNLISEQRGNDESFLLMDGHSGVRILTDKLGNLTDTSSYDAYGNVTNPLSAEFGYRGESFEDLTRLQYLRARYYEPSTGRFLGVDPFEGDVSSPVSRHRYLYGNANPVSYADPSGMFSIGEAVAVLTILGSLASTSYQTYSIANALDQSHGNTLKWNGFIQADSIAFGLLGFGGTVAYTNLTSECYGSTNTHAIYGLLGVGISVSPLPLYVSTVANALQISSPYNSGNDPGILTGAYNTLSGNIVTPVIGASWTAYLYMGQGFSILSSINPLDNLAWGLDLSAGITSGVSFKIYSYSTPSLSC